MGVVAEVKMEKVDDELRIIVPEAVCKDLGFEEGDTLLVTVEEEKVVMKKKHRKTAR